MHNLHDLWSKIEAVSFLHAVLLIILGYFISRFVSISVEKASKKRLTMHQVVLFKRVLFYGIFLLFLASAVEQLGFQINALLGATGILTVAIGIAAQTSMSNLISGVFIIGEKPFAIGDTIRVDKTQGIVLAIDFLSVKVRTSDNTMVRIPNETLIKSSITNLSYFPIRRIELIVGVSFKEDIEKITKILLNIADKNTFCLTEPKPAVTVDSFGDSAVNLLFACWVNKENISDAKHMLQTEIKAAFNQANITIPFPTRTLYIEKEKEE